LLLARNIPSKPKAGNEVVRRSLWHEKGSVG